uniref:Putative serine/threonine-protein kinase DDB_G0283337 n=1 Tax=Lygus hesperus TaxID=30085 RepID=A0A0A9X6M3_LYGHE
MPKPKVYREYFPSCIERFFGGGRPRRIKARCFVPYTEAEENTDVLLGPTPGAPNIDLNMMVVKDRNEDCFSNEEGSIPQLEETCSQRMDCGCKCRCSDNNSSTNSSFSTTCYSSSDYRSSKSVKSRPKILVLEDDGRYREIHEEFIGVHRAPKQGVRKSVSLKSAKLVMKDAKIDVICPSMPSPNSSTPAASEVFTWDECANIAVNQERHQEGSKKGVVLGYVMFDPDSEDKRLYVTTTDGKRITPATPIGNRS